VDGIEPTERIRALIRLRGAPDDPEAWDLASWNGIVWEVRRELPNGRRITLQIRDYLVVERLAPETDLARLYVEERLVEPE
jgi:hypothetical protein